VAHPAAGDEPARRDGAPAGPGGHFNDQKPAVPSALPRMPVGRSASQCRTGAPDGRTTSSSRRSGHPPLCNPRDGTPQRRLGPWPDLDKRRCPVPSEEDPSAAEVLSPQSIVGAYCVADREVRSRLASLLDQDRRLPDCPAPPTRCSMYRRADRCTASPAFRTICRRSNAP
jgi:hypothetical protein